MVGTLGERCRYVTSWSDFDLTIDLAVVTLIFKIMSRVYLRNHKVCLVLNNTW